MNRFLERLESGAVLVADGATGTNLQRMGIRPGTPPEQLVLDDPDTVLELANAFVASGADILLTCTFGGTRLRMGESKYAGRAAEVNARAAALARQAASQREGVLVAGSMGPTGALMKPFGPLEPELAREAYAEQAGALAQGGVDLLLIETMFALEEADAALEGARSATDLPVVVSFSYDRGVATMMGVRPAAVVRSYQEKGAALVGANCGTSLENMEKVLAEYAGAAPGFPLWAKPNAGLPRMDPQTDTAVYDTSPEQMGAFALKYVALGARVVGGCCGSTPEHVAGIAGAVKDL